MCFYSTNNNIKNIINFDMATLDAYFYFKTTKTPIASLYPPCGGHKYPLKIYYIITAVMVCFVASIILLKNYIITVWVATFVAAIISYNIHFIIVPIVAFIAAVIHPKKIPIL